MPTQLRNAVHTDIISRAGDRSIRQRFISLGLGFHGIAARDQVASRIGPDGIAPSSCHIGRVQGVGLLAPQGIAFVDACPRADCTGHLLGSGRLGKCRGGKQAQKAGKQKTHDEPL